MKQLYTIISLLFLFTHTAWAQQHEIFNQRISHTGVKSVFSRLSARKKQSLIGFMVPT